jgi:hypothetical protein
MQTLKFSLLLAVLSFGNLYANTNCISDNDLKDISVDFLQFETFLTEKAEYCESDLGTQWYKIAQSLVTLKNSSPDEPTIDADDAFTYQAISEKDWWAYFTKRASKFIIHSNCREGVIAYVQPFFGAGTINLCEPFFDMPISSQASVMMHEVRHFDGHRHVTCTQGNENGSGGACDQKITGQGSYAISVQTLVGLARSKDTLAEEKPLVEAEATYMAFNKFNVVPEVKINHSMLLSNKAGEVYSWVIGKSADLVKTLSSPAVLNGSGRHLTIYPSDTNLDAYRMDNGLTATVDNPGLYAKHYNEQSVQERAKYKSISYNGTGGLLKENSLTTLCNQTSLELGNKKLDSVANMKRILTISNDSKSIEQESYLLSENGDLYPYECKSTRTTAVTVGNSKMKLDSTLLDVKQTLSLGKDHFGVKEDGTLVKMSYENNTFSEEPMTMPIENSDWLSATPISKPQVF